METENNKTLSGAELIAAERRRQIEQEGFDASHDHQHIENEIAWGAICYTHPHKRLIKKRDDVPASAPTIYLKDGPEGEGTYLVLPPSMWPWDLGSWKPGAPGSLRGRIRELTKAGAMIAAEIDRLNDLLKKDEEENEEEHV